MLNFVIYTIKNFLKCLNVFTDLLKIEQVNMLNTSFNKIHSPAFGARIERISRDVGSLKRFNGDEEKFAEHVERKTTSIIRRELKDGHFSEAFNTLNNMCVLARHKRYSAEKNTPKYFRKSAEAEILEEKAQDLFEKTNFEETIKKKMQAKPSHGGITALAQQINQMERVEKLLIPRFLKPLVNFLSKPQ
jgi:hypothetical protein